MDFPFGQTVVRERRHLIEDPRAADGSMVPGSWDDALDTLELAGSFVASSSSIGSAEQTRNQVLTSKSLYLTDPDADVAVGDRIAAPGGPYYVNARPEADTNPFTGWRPVVEIPLDATEG